MVEDVDGLAVQRACTESMSTNAIMKCAARGLQAVGIGSGAAAAASATAAIKWITKDAVGVAGRLLVGGGSWGDIAVLEAL